MDDGNRLKAHSLQPADVSARRRPRLSLATHTTKPSHWRAFLLILSGSEKVTPKER
jgi:hypothetical protein